MIENQEATQRLIQSELQTCDTHWVYEERKWWEARNGIDIWPAANHRVACWVMWSKRVWQILWFKKWTRWFCFIFIYIFTPGNPICGHLKWVPLRFVWIVLLPLLQWASEPEVPDISESFPEPVVLVRGPAVEWQWLETRGEGITSMMRSLRFLGDLQFGLVLKDYFWSKIRFSQTIVSLDLPSSVRFLLFLADCTWEYFLFNVCMSTMSFILLSFIHSINQHYPEGESMFHLK